MKIAIVHLSDFHIHEGEGLLDQKINGIVSALNVLGNVDDYVVVFSGDLSYSGQVNQFKQARPIFEKILKGIKQKNGNKFVNTFMVPGNHDLCLPPNARERKDIQEHYDNSTIEELLSTENSYLENYYSYSFVNGTAPQDIFINKKCCNFGDYKVQFNLINTAFFSTLLPDDKELHYFPDDRIKALTRDADTDLCVTVMHHSCEWFNWKCKSNLEKAVIDNSEFLLYGHDHRERTGSVSIDNSLDTWISAAGEMKFAELDYVDTFNAIVVDTSDNSFDGYVFNWDPKVRIYIHKILAKKKDLQNHTTALTPLPSFIKSLKEDTYNVSDNFTEYFVFPKLMSDTHNKNEKEQSAATIEDFKKILSKNKKIFISGATNSGKTTLLKYLYCSLTSEASPLFLSADNKQRLKIHNFIRHLFEDQYGEEQTLFERYQQLDLDKKVLIVDGWDQLNVKDQEPLLEKIEESFGYIILGVSDIKTDLLEAVKARLGEESQYIEMHIKPFFAEKRNELVRNVCLYKSICNEEDINNVTHIIDSLVRNNKELFSLNPAFIVRYTNYFIQNPYQDYTKGEAVFSRIFEYELTQSILRVAKTQDVDELFATFEELAGYMFSNKKDKLVIQEVNDVIRQYNQSFGENVESKDVISVGMQTKILRYTGDMSIYFANKNHLSYFIAKYLIRVSQNEPYDTTGINYAMQNICFGINADIILFVSYILNSTRILTLIKKYAGELLQPWEAINFQEKNISLFHSTRSEQVTPPTEEEKKTYDAVKENMEEKTYSEEIIEARGLFDYDDSDIDQQRYRLIRAIKYTELICKALPAFHSKLMVNQKKELIESIYLYPRKIVFAILHPLDINLEETCKQIRDFAEQNNKRKKNGDHYTKDDILMMINDSARAIMLGIFDHFAELASSQKTSELLTNTPVSDMSEQLERLLMIEFSGNTNNLVKEANSLLKSIRDQEHATMVKLIVRKHLLTNRSLTFSKRQQVIDKIFGDKYRKDFLLTTK